MSLKFRRVPYICDLQSERFSQDDLHLFTLGGRDVQEDDAIYDEQDGKKSYILFDGFGGQSVPRYARKQFARILKKCNHDAKRTIDLMDSYLRVNALYNKDYKFRVHKSHTVQAYENLYEAAASYLKGKRASIKEFTERDQENKRSSEKTESENIEFKKPEHPETPEEKKKRKEKKKAHELAQELQLESEFGQFLENNKEFAEDYAKFLKEQYKKIKSEGAQQFENEIAKQSYLYMRQHKEDLSFIHIGLFEALSHQFKDLDDGNNYEQLVFKELKETYFDQLKLTIHKDHHQLFDSYKEIILLLNDYQHQFKFGEEGNSHQVRVDGIQKLIKDNNSKVWGNYFELKGKVVEDDGAEELIKLLPQYNKQNIKFFTPFYRPKVPIQEDIKRGWELLLFLCTHSYLQKGLPQSNPLLSNDLTEEEQQEWQLAADEAGILSDKNVNDSQDMEELDEDMALTFQAALSAIDHYVIRRVSKEYDPFQRFGNRVKVGAVLVLVIVDTNKEKGKQLQIAWRGDTMAVGVDSDYKGTVLNKEHKSKAGLTLEVGRFLGGLQYDAFYKANKSRETKTVSQELLGKDWKQLVLMTDGAFHKWQDGGQKNFPSDFFDETLTQYFQDIMETINFHQKGYDNSSMLRIILDRTPVNKSQESVQQLQK